MTSTLMNLAAKHNFLFFFFFFFYKVSFCEITALLDESFIDGKSLFFVVGLMCIIATCKSQ